ncbi:MAG: hypothetical protein R3229_16150 [Alphaproteobacteria bacterium]|nr:hypothetical protein [Alphaproteobacteria bacterium]
MASQNSIIHPWRVALLYAATALLLIVAPPSAQAHCAGKHTGDHPHCSGEEPPPPPADFNPELVWIKDGQHIVVANRDGTNPTIIFTRSSGQAMSSVSWSPGGLEILFPITEGPQGPGIYRLPIFDGVADATHPRGNFSVGAPTRVGASQPGVSFISRAHWSPVPAPDGNYWIAFTAYVSETENCNEVFLINPADAGGQPISLDVCPRFADDLTWSPDGTRLAVTTAVGAIGDLEIFSLEAGGPGLVVSDHVSLLLGNEFLDPTSDLANSYLDKMDWSNTLTRNEIVASGGGLWIIPVPDTDPSSLQWTVANETAVAIGDDQVGRWLPAWSADDTALLYRREYDRDGGGICDVPPLSGKGKNKNFRDLAIGVLDNGAPNDDPDKIECVEPDDETALNVDGVWAQWWRGTFPQPPLPLPSP